MRSEFPRLPQFKLLPVVLGLVASVALTACAVDSESDGGGDKEVTVGIVNSYTGVLASYGPEWEGGFRAALADLTKDGEVNGVKIKVEVKDDKSDPAVGVSAAKELLGDGADVIAGTASSAIVPQVAQLALENDRVFLAGCTVSPVLTAMGKGIFRTQGDSVQVNNTVLAAITKNGGKKVAYLGADYAYGQQAAAQLADQGKPMGITVDPILMPPSTQDFTPGVAKAMNSGADTIYVGWTSEGQTQLYQALADQGAFKDDSKVTVIAVGPQTQNLSAVAKAVGPTALPKLQLVTFYYPGTTDNPADKSVVSRSTDKTTLDQQQASGYLAGQMLVKAIETDGTDMSPDAFDAAVSGQAFVAPQGEVTVRAEDHALLTPMALYTIVADGSGHTLKIDHTFATDEVDYPVGEKTL